ncbi:MAG TPA: tRNA epoxyqueuosine(34) reductase QueG [Methylomirabilota bacterium]
MTLTTLALHEAVKARAGELGFDRVAIGPATPPTHGREFARWLDAGYAGTMTYLARGREDRLDPARLLPGARAVVAVALAYAPADESPEWHGVARYARGADYHDVMRPRLEALARFLREAGGVDVRSRVAVDTSAVLERDLAARAGLGWIGKNTNVIDQTLGSYFFIGIVITTADLALDEPVPDRCGTCRACLDACPTGAFVAPYVLDARRCISYLTIEHRDDIPDELREAIGDWAFGCDVCQEVCPWNRKAPPTREPAFEPAAAFPPLASLLELDDAGFRARFRGTALWRARRRGLLRNASIVLANRGTGADAVEHARRDPDEVVARAAEWAAERLRRP